MHPRLARGLTGEHVLCVSEEGGAAAGVQEDGLAVETAICHMRQKASERFAGVDRIEQDALSAGEGALCVEAFR